MICLRCHRKLAGQAGQGTDFDSSHTKMRKIDFNAQGKKLLPEKVAHHLKLFHYHVVLEGLEGILEKLGKCGVQASKL